MHWGLDGGRGGGGGAQSEVKLVAAGGGGGGAKKKKKEKARIIRQESHGHRRSLQQCQSNSLTGTHGLEEEAESSID